LLIATFSVLPSIGSNQNYTKCAIPLAGSIGNYIYNMMFGIITTATVVL
jgi:hypothetical protein